MTKKPTRPKKTVFRDSRTGEFVKKKFAEKHPDTTEKERVPIVPPGKATD